MGRLATKVRNRIGAWAARGGPLRQAFYYRYLSDAFQREHDAVAHGITAYRAASERDNPAYLMRRNVHMIEKGLTMRPRRDEFAVEYIERTIDATRRSIESGYLSTVSDECGWVLSVLREYFVATSASTHPAIVKSRLGFKSLDEQMTPRRYGMGPAAAVPPNSEAPLDFDHLLRLATERRSVRWFLDQPVPRDMLDNAVRVAAEAPTACNRQPYRFEVFDDPDSVEAVAAIPMGTRGFREQIPGIIVVVGDMSAFFDERDRHLIYVDGCLASMGLILGLEAQGIATCSINWPDMPEREREMRSLLGLAKYERVIMLIAYGYADPEGLVPYSAKREVESVRRFGQLSARAQT